MSEYAERTMALAPPLSRAQEARRRKVIDLLTGGRQYAVYVEDAGADPIILALATPDGTADVLIPQDKYDAFAVLAMVENWERESLPQAGPGDAEPGRLWWRVAITEPGGKRFEVDAPSGCTLPDWRAYALRFHAPESVVAPLAELPKPQAPVPLEDAVAGAVEAVGGITAEGLRSGRVALPERIS